MRKLCSVTIKAELKPGTSITAVGVPDLIELANRTGCTVQAKANDVTILAYPGDDPIDLAIAWEQESNGKSNCKIAVAWQGRQHLIRQLSLSSTQSKE